MLFLLSIFAWFSCLFLFRPTPSDLKAKIPKYRESFKNIQATFWLGIFLILAFFIFSGGDFIRLQDAWFSILAVNNVDAINPWWFVQSFTHTLVHFNLMHLLTNLSFLGILSLYERKTSAGRFLAVFFFGGILSSFSIFLMSEPTGSVGASAGLCALASAFILDTPGLTRKEYILCLCGIVLLFSVISFTQQMESKKSIDITIDYWGHAFGLFFGFVFCKIFPKRNTL